MRSGLDVDIGIEGDEYNPEVAQNTVEKSRGEESGKVRVLKQLQCPLGRSNA